MLSFIGFLTVIYLTIGVILTAYFAITEPSGLGPIEKPRDYVELVMMLGVSIAFWPVPFLFGF